MYVCMYVCMCVHIYVQYIHTHICYIYYSHVTAYALLAIWLETVNKHRCY